MFFFFLEVKAKIAQLSEMISFVSDSDHISSPVSVFFLLECVD